MGTQPKGNNANIANQETNKGVGHKEDDKQEGDKEAGVYNPLRQNFCYVYIIEPEKHLG